MTNSNKLTLEQAVAYLQSRPGAHTKTRQGLKQAVQSKRVRRAGFRKVDGTNRPLLLVFQEDLDALVESAKENGRHYQRRKNINGTYTMRDPSGELVTFPELRAFLKEHPELKRRPFCEVIAGSKNQYKGWTRPVTLVIEGVMLEPQTLTFYFATENEAMLKRDFIYSHMRHGKTVTIDGKTISQVKEARIE